MSVNPNTSVAVQKTKTISWKTLKCSVEQKGTAELLNDGFWMHFPYHDVYSLTLVTIRINIIRMISAISFILFRMTAVRVFTQILISSTGISGESYFCCMRVTDICGNFSPLHWSCSPEQTDLRRWPGICQDHVNLQKQIEKLLLFSQIFLICSCVNLMSLCAQYL